VCVVSLVIGRVVSCHWPLAIGRVVSVRAVRAVPCVRCGAVR
jgi:hypothetical protein